MMTIKQEREKRRKGKKENTFRFWAVFSLFLIVILFNLACQPNQEILKSSSNINSASNLSPAATLEPRRTTFEQDIAEMKDAGLDSIYVLRRKDSGVFDSEDSKFIRKNTPIETNRFVFAEEKKTLIVGSGFSLPLENINALKKRYKFEDLSKPIEVEVRASPINANK